MTMSPERGTETTLIYNAGQVTAVITLNIDLRTSDTYYFYLYNDEQMSNVSSLLYCLDHISALLETAY